MITLTYQQLYKINRVEAREMLLKAFKESGKSYLKTAKLLGCSRNTVKKFIKRKRMGLGLDDLSRRPKASPHQTQKEIEDLVERCSRQTNFGRVRLAKYLETKYKVPLSANTFSTLDFSMGYLI